MGAKFVVIRIEMGLVRLLRPGGSKIALVRLTGTYIYSSACVNTQSNGGSGGMLPQENFLEFDAVKWLLRLFFRAQNITVNLCFSPGLVAS